MDVKSFDAMAVEGKSLLIYDHNRSERDTALGDLKRHWVVLSRCCTRNFVTLVAQTWRLSNASRSCPSVTGCETLSIQTWRWLMEIRSNRVRSSISCTQT